MAFLINRNPAARFQCLHALCRLIAARFSTTQSFSLNDIKFESGNRTIHNHCRLLVSSNSLRITHCPYKSPLDSSGCSLTNSVKVDSTKSKEVSNTVNSLHGLGLVTRSAESNVQLTELGATFAYLENDDTGMHQVIRRATLNYGPMVGLLGQVYLSGQPEFDTNELVVGYPSTRETVDHNGESVTISSGSEPDSNTRTKSCLLAWGTTAGFFHPTSLEVPNRQQAHIDTAAYINQERRPLRRYKVLHIDEIFRGDFKVNRTLDYNNLTKNSKALRESNQASVRGATMAATRTIQNRRFCILHRLNSAFESGSLVSLDDLAQTLTSNPNLYLLNPSNIAKVLRIELGICNSAGIVYRMIGDKIKPLNGINLTELSVGAPRDLLDDLA